MKKISVNNLSNLSLVLAGTFLTTLGLSSCTNLGVSKHSPSKGDSNLVVSLVPHKSDDEISIMSFNVENLFDTQHDEGKEDYTYLPLSVKGTPEHKAACEKMGKSHQKECMTLDWNDQILDKKFQSLSQVILSVDENGPDNLIVLEVENERVLKMLNEKYLSKARYQTVVLIEGDDDRGIDVGFFSKFPLAGQPVLHKIQFTPQNDKDKLRMGKTRGILEVPVKLPNGEKMIVLGGHFPSQANPRYWREQAVNHMAKLIEKNSDKNIVVAGGDLNITEEEESSAQFFHQNFSKVGLVSHLIGCKDCKGSHFYRKSWSFLDALIFSKNLAVDGASTYVLNPGSIQIIKHPIHTKYGEIPKRFDDEKGTGVSDHFPLYAKIKKRTTSVKLESK